MLTIEHLTKSYGDKKAVDNLSLHIAPEPGQGKGIAQLQLRVGLSPGAELFIAFAARGVQTLQLLKLLQQRRLPRLKHQGELSPGNG